MCWQALAGYGEQASKCGIGAGESHHVTIMYVLPLPLDGHHLHTFQPCRVTQMLFSVCITVHWLHIVPLLIELTHISAELLVSNQHAVYL